MCGIFCYYGTYYTLEDLREKFQRIKHRGPDDTELIQVADNVIFGFHRLSIHGLTKKANQPLVSEDKQITLICNGEIYNYLKLAKKYGIELKTGSDCEIIIHLYQIFGIDAIRNLDAEFAFILYDHSRRALFSGRDLIGVRPLFLGKPKYFNNYAEFFLSSELKSIVDLTDYTEQFQPGHIRVQTFDEYMKMEPNIKLKKLTISYLSNIHKLLIEAVRKRLDSERPIGFLLSGGLDSSLICSIAQKINNRKNYHTFSIGLPESQDILAAREVSAYIKSVHHEVIFSLKEGLNVIPEVIYHLETFDTTTIRAGVPQYLLAKYIAKYTNIKVLLSGEGADELFYGYKYHSFAPNAQIAQYESEELIANLHKYDILRTDRTLAAHGLEVRVPYLDFNFFKYIYTLDPHFKYQPEKIEKLILRQAFVNNYIPKKYLYRQKDAMSDAVGHKWIEYTTENAKLLLDEDYIKTNIKDKKIQECLLDINKNKINYHSPTPPTEEALIYRKIFEAFFPGNANVIGKYWMPKWRKTNDPSARFLI